MSTNISDRRYDRVVFLPDFSILRYLSIDECLSFLTSSASRGAADQDAPEKARPAVCLPLIHYSGVAFDTSLTTHSLIDLKVEVRTKTRSFGQIVREFVDRGCDVYFYVNPALDFLDLPLTHVADIRGVGSPTACFYKSHTRQILKKLIADGISAARRAMDDNEELLSRLRGLAIDIASIWGMGGEEEAVHMTCFCDECRRYYVTNGVNVDSFQTRPSPWHLGLRASDTGVSYIDNFDPNDTADSIIGKSRLRGFDQPFEDADSLRQAAESLKKFMDVRHNLVEEVLADLFDSMGSIDGGSKLRRIVITEGVDYDWTSGVFLSSLSNKVVHEVWLDPTDKAHGLGIPHRFFMCRRSTYFINALYDFLWSASDDRIRTATQLANMTEDSIKRELKRRLYLVVNGIQADVRALSFIYGGAPKFRGFVSVLLDGAIAEDIMQDALTDTGLH